MIHGLISDPVTWTTLVNELQMDPLVEDRYEFWAFGYPTGKPFLYEAAILRRKLQAARTTIDPLGQDPSLDRIVLIGHSMGGLVAKLQVTSSGNGIANSLSLAPNAIQRLGPDVSESVYWRPVKSVRRVVFIATPHRGSELASRPLGRFGSQILRMETSPLDSFGELVVTSRDQLLRSDSNMPTTIDMLQPENPTLQAIAALPIDPHVTAHSIIGCGRGGLFIAPGDGVVPMTSAHIDGVESELYVDSSHDVHRRPAAIAEVRRILAEHARCHAAVKVR